MNALRSVGPVLARIACDVWQNWLVAFVVAGTACLVAAGIFGPWPSGMLSY